MKHFLRRLLPVMALLVVMPALAKAAPLPFVKTMQTATQNWRGQLLPLSEAADETAAKLINGGHLYVASTQRSFRAEALGRAGGLMLAHALGRKTALTSKDTILAGLAPGFDPAVVKDVLQRAQKAHTKVLFFAGPSRQKLSKSHNVALFPKHVFNDVSYQNSVGAETVSNTIGLWTFTAQLVAACVRRGHMPTMFLSDAMPGGRERNAQFRKSTFHTQTNVTPDSVRELGSRYLDALSVALRQMDQSQAPAFHRAAKMIHTATATRHQIYIAYIGHMFPSELKGPDRPDWQIGKRTKNDAIVPATLKKGDVLFYIDYQHFPWDLTTALQQKGIGSIITSSMGPLDHWKTDSDIVYINPFWKVRDAAVPLAGYDISILPTSGILQSTVYWQLVGLVGK